jgi:hypothetical protein
MALEIPSPSARPANRISATALTGRPCGSARNRTWTCARRGLTASSSADPRPSESLSSSFRACRRGSPEAKKRGSAGNRPSRQASGSTNATVYSSSIVRRTRCAASRRSRGRTERAGENTLTRPSSTASSNRSGSGEGDGDEDGPLTGVGLASGRTEGSSWPNERTAQPSTPATSARDAAITASRLPRRQAGVASPMNAEGYPVSAIVQGRRAHGRSRAAAPRRRAQCSR